MVVVVVMAVDTRVEGGRGEEEVAFGTVRFLFRVGEAEREEGCIKNLSLTTLEKYLVF